MKRFVSIVIPILSLLIIGTIGFYHFLQEDEELERLFEGRSIDIPNLVVFFGDENVMFQGDAYYIHLSDKKSWEGHDSIYTIGLYKNRIYFYEQSKGALGIGHCEMDGSNPEFFVCTLPEREDFSFDPDIVIMSEDKIYITNASKTVAYCVYMDTKECVLIESFEEIPLTTRTCTILMNGNVISINDQNNNIELTASSMHSKHDVFDQLCVFYEKQKEPGYRGVKINELFHSAIVNNEKVYFNCQLLEKNGINIRYVFFCYDLKTGDLYYVGNDVGDDNAVIRNIGVAIVP